MAHRIGIDARKLGDFGIGTYVQNLIRSLATLDRENEYFLFVGPSADGTLGELPENFHLVTERAPVYSMRELVALSWRLLRLKLDLYHATHYVLPSIVPCKAVVTIHDIIHLLYPEFLPSRLAFFYAQRMIRRSLHRGDRIITPSLHTKSDLLAHFDVDGHKLQVVRQGVADRFRDPVPLSTRESILKDLGIPSPYLLFVGNPKPHKNLGNVVKAFARALEIKPFEGSLVCVGDRGGTSFKTLQRAQQLGIEDRVLLKGEVDEEVLPAIYQGASLFLYPTLYEGFGLPVVEAMASGVAVITSNSSALQEIAEGYADLVNPLDVEEIARTIAHAMTDRPHRETLAELGRRRAEDFHWERTAQQTLDVYMQAIHAGDPKKA